MSRFGTVGYKAKKEMSGYDNVHLEYIPLEHFVFLFFILASYLIGSCFLFASYILLISPCEFMAPLDFPHFPVRILVFLQYGRRLCIWSNTWSTFTHSLENWRIGVLALNLLHFSGD